MLWVTWRGSGGYFKAVISCHSSHNPGKYSEDWFFWKMWKVPNSEKYSRKIGKSLFPTMGGGSNSRISTHSLLILPNAKIVNFKICQQVTTMAFGSLPLQPPQFHDISNCLYKRKHRYMRTAKSHHSFFNSLTISTSLTFITRLLDIHFHILHPFSFIGHQCHQTYHHGHQSH